MKKQWLILLILLIIPLAKATITLEGPSKDIYNIGDKLDIKVDIIELEQIHGLLKIELNCETTSPLLIKTISLDPNEKYSLEEELPIPYFLTGTCSIITSIQKGETTLDQTQSKTFTISNELTATLELDTTEAQLGEKITLTGTITKQDTTPLKGIANIFLKTNENIVSMETLDITKGSLEHEFDTSAKPAGTYIIEIDALDIYGNKYTSNELTFNLIDQLILTLELDKTETLPDSKIKLTGIIKDIKDNPIKEGKVSISFKDELYLTEISKGSFSQKISISDTIKSGQHTIHAIVEDEFGNLAEKDISFSVTPIPTALELKTSKEIITPESLFKITVFVYDQAAEQISDKATLKVTSPEKEKILEKEVLTEEEVNIEIPQSASPGLWTITSFTAGGLKTKKQITVEEVSSINVEIEGQSIKVKNTGNIKYKDPIQVTFKSASLETTKTIKTGLFGIKPTAFATYDLGKYIKSGTYDILVNNKEFNEIPINNTSSFFSIYYLIPVAIIIVFLLFLFISKNIKFKPKKIKKTKEQRDFEKAKERAEELRAKKPPLTQTQQKDKYKKDFMKSMLKQVEKRDQQIKKRLKFDFTPKKSPPKSFISMKLPRTPQKPSIIGTLQRKPIEQKPSIISTLQKPPEKSFEKKSLWRILRKKGIPEKPKTKPPEKPGLFSMFD